MRSCKQEGIHAVVVLSWSQVEKLLVAQKERKALTFQKVRYAWPMTPDLLLSRAATKPHIAAMLAPPLETKINNNVLKMIIVNAVIGVCSIVRVTTSHGGRPFY